MTTHTFTYQSFANERWDEWSNALSLEATYDEISAGATPDDDAVVMPLVRVDTNYKAGRPGKNPVKLTVLDALKAATALISLTEASVDRCVHVLDRTHDDDALLALLEQLAQCDGAIWELRNYVHNEIRHRRGTQDEETVAVETASGKRTTFTEVFADDLAAAAEAPTTEKGGQ